VREWLAGEDAMEGEDALEGEDAPEEDGAGRDGTGREPVNLNVLSRPSGNLRLNGG
jgi:hypothetical protein